MDQIMSELHDYGSNHVWITRLWIKSCLNYTIMDHIMSWLHDSGSYSDEWVTATKETRMKKTGQTRQVSRWDKWHCHSKHQIIYARHAIDSPPVVHLAMSLVVYQNVKAVTRKSSRKGKVWYEQWWPSYRFATCGSPKLSRVFSTLSAVRFCSFYTQLRLILFIY